LLYLAGGFVFGYYSYSIHHSFFKDSPSAIIIDTIFQIKNPTLSDSLQFLWNNIKIGLDGFFNFPSSETSDTVTICQFFIGKFIELVILATVCSKILGLGLDSEEKLSTPIYTINYRTF
jgi:hypothetical protein